MVHALDPAQEMFVEANPADPERHARQADLSPVSGKPVVARFDSGLLAMEVA